MVTHDQAKEIFTKYLGNHYFINREEGDEGYEKYLQFNVPKETEQMWRREMLDELYPSLLKEPVPNKLNSIFSRYETVLRGAKDISYVKLLSNLISNIPISFLKLIRLEAMLEILKGLRGKEYHDFRKTELQEHLMALKAMRQADEIPVDQSFKDDPILKAFPGAFEQSKLKARVEQAIAEYEKELHA